MYKDSMSLKIDRNRCIHCASCVRECLNQVLEMGEDRFPREAKGGTERCIHCQHCVMICPKAALSVDSVDPDACPAIGEYPSPEQMLNLYRGRRSFRYYRNENVSTQIIGELLDAMRYSPTGVNSHQLLFTVIDDRKVMDKIRNYVNGKLIDFLEQSPESELAVKLAAMGNGVREGKDPIFRNAPHMVLVSSPENAPCRDIDPVIALSYFELLAQTKGIATVWCGLAMRAFLAVAPEAFGMLGVPENYKPVYTMLFGLPKIKFSRSGVPDPVRIFTPGEKDIL